MTHKEFLQLDEYERKVFIAKLINAIMKNEECFRHADYIIVMSEKEGKFKVKFGNEIYKENDQLTTTK